MFVDVDTVIADPFKAEVAGVVRSTRTVAFSVVAAILVHRRWLVVIDVVVVLVVGKCNLCVECLLVFGIRHK